MTVCVRMGSVCLAALTLLLTVWNCDSESDTGGKSAITNESIQCGSIGPDSDKAVSLENEVVTLVNERRQVGADCGTGGIFGAAPPLTMNAQLQCAARAHTNDMVARNFFDHISPDGTDPFGRIENAGYVFSAAAENIAAGDTTAVEVVQGWMASDGHCANIMNPEFIHIGVGFANGDVSNTFGTYWTQTFGAP
ncbi:MAG: CAP domain-containing protein [Myxococcales bacterium]|nr:CAP domain-containing protein [Myxococcales bacterium]